MATKTKKHQRIWVRWQRSVRWLKHYNPFIHFPFVHSPFVFSLCTLLSLSNTNGPPSPAAANHHRRRRDQPSFPPSQIPFPSTITITKSLRRSPSPSLPHQHHLLHALLRRRVLSPPQMA